MATNPFIQGILFQRRVNKQNRGAPLPCRLACSRRPPFCTWLPVSASPPGCSATRPSYAGCKIHTCPQQTRNRGPKVKVKAPAARSSGCSQARAFRRRWLVGGFRAARLEPALREWARAKEKDTNKTHKDVASTSSKSRIVSAAGGGCAIALPHCNSFAALPSSRSKKMEHAHRLRIRTDSRDISRLERRSRKKNARKQQGKKLTHVGSSSPSPSMTTSHAAKLDRQKGR